MTTRVTIFSKDGYFVGDIRTNPTYEYVLNATPSAGRCTFDLSLSSAKVTPKYLEFGNYVLIRNTYLPDWIGIIVKRTWGFGSVQIMAMQAEWILTRRITPILTYTGTAGSIFNQILSYTNGAKYNEKPITPNNLFLGGVSREEKLGNDALSHIQAVAERSGNDFDVTYNFDTNGKLYLLGNWYERKGGYTSKYLREGKNISTSERVFDEDARQLANWYEGRGDANTTGTRITATKYDDTSISKYGLMQEAGVFDGNSVMATLENNTLNKLYNLYAPQGAFDLTATEGAFSFLRIGDVYELDLNTVGFINGGRGYQGFCRLVGMEYDSMNNTTRLIVTRWKNETA